MSYIKKSNIRPLRKDSRCGRAEELHSGYEQSSCPICGEQFSLPTGGLNYCPKCDTSLIRYSRTGTPSAPETSSARPRQSVARTSTPSRTRSTQPELNPPTHRRIIERIERQLPSIRDVPVLRDALNIEVPPVQNRGQHGDRQQYVSLRGSQDGQPALPPLRARRATQHDRRVEHQESPVLPDPRRPSPYSHPRTDQYADTSGHGYQGYHQYWDNE
ncbi:hypothetical protein F4803DRAFT_554682 [Xylaria telfairii]|nr:hypothetical protein F4803DRAFT_554682 [Xylaria telfairii]